MMSKEGFQAVITKFNNDSEFRAIFLEEERRLDLILNPEEFKLSHTEISELMVYPIEIFKESSFP